MRQNCSILPIDKPFTICYHGEKIYEPDKKMKIKNVMGMLLSLAFVGQCMAFTACNGGNLPEIPPVSIPSRFQTQTADDYSRVTATLKEVSDSDWKLYTLLEAYDNGWIDQVGIDKLAHYYNHFTDENYHFELPENVDELLIPTVYKSFTPMKEEDRQGIINAYTAMQREVRANTNPEDITIVNDYGDYGNYNHCYVVSMKSRFETFDIKMPDLVLGDDIGDTGDNEFHDYSENMLMVWGNTLLKKYKNPTAAKGNLYSLPEAYEKGDLSETDVAKLHENYADILAQKYKVPSKAENMT